MRPLAWHALALELDQVRVVDWPRVSAVGLAPMLTITELLAEEAFPAGADEPPPPPQETSTRHAATAASLTKPLTRG